MKNFKFFIGGADLEMIRIKEVLTQASVAFEDANLGWGAAASNYGDKIAKAAVAKFIPVLVELDVDCDLPKGSIVIDHHGERSDEPAAIMQVLALLGIAPTRWDLLVAANDTGYIPALLAMGATAEEVTQIRLADRSAQGITAEQEQQAEAAIAAPLEMLGEYRIIRIQHSKSSPVADRLFDGKPERLIILSEDGEANFFGRGDICVSLKEKFKGWNGGSGLGSKKSNAFWGGYPSQKELIEFLKELIA